MTVPAADESPWGIASKGVLICMVFFSSSAPCIIPTECGDLSLSLLPYTKSMNGMGIIARAMNPNVPSAHLGVRLLNTSESVRIKPCEESGRGLVWLEMKATYFGQ